MRVQLVPLVTRAPNGPKFNFLNTLLKQQQQQQQQQLSAVLLDGLAFLGSHGLLHKTWYFNHGRWGLLP